MSSQVGHRLNRQCYMTCLHSPGVDGAPDVVRPDSASDISVSLISPRPRPSTSSSVACSFASVKSLAKYSTLPSVHPNYVARTRGGGEDGRNSVAPGAVVALSQIRSKCYEGRVHDAALLSSNGEAGTCLYV